jgi:hypothetical protein
MANSSGRRKTRRRYSKKRYSKKRYSKKRYSKKRYSKKRYSKKQRGGLPFTGPEQDKLKVARNEEPPDRAKIREIFAARAAREAVEAAEKEARTPPPPQPQPEPEPQPHWTPPLCLTPNCQPQPQAHAEEHLHQQLQIERARITEIDQERKLAAKKARRRKKLDMLPDATDAECDEEEARLGEIAKNTKIAQKRFPGAGGLKSWQLKGPLPAHSAAEWEKWAGENKKEFWGEAKERPSRLTFGSDTTKREYDPTDDHTKGGEGQVNKNWGGLVARPLTAAHSTICRGFNRDDCGETKGSIGCEWDAWKEWNGMDGCVPIVTPQPMITPEEEAEKLEIRRQTMMSQIPAEQLILSVFGEAIKAGGNAGPRIVDVPTLKASILHHNINLELLPKIAEILDDIIRKINEGDQVILPKSTVKLNVGMEPHLVNLRSWLATVIES